MEASDLLTRLREMYPGLSKGQKQIASYIMNNYDRAAFVTAAHMGKATGVSESTVVRFSYNLGYDGYPALQRALQEVIRTKLTSIQRIQLTSDMDQANILKSVLKADIQNIRMTIDTVDNEAFLKAVDELLCAQRIFVAGMRSAYPIAQFLVYYLRHVCTGMVAINDSLHDACELVAQIDKDDVFMAISFPRYCTRTVQAIRHAKKKGAVTIALTDGAKSPLAPYADYLLTARSDMASYADSLVAPLSLINAIIVAAGVTRKDALVEHFDEMERLWGSQQVYVTEYEDKPLK